MDNNSKFKSDPYNDSNFLIAETDLFKYYEIILIFKILKLIIYLFINKHLIHNILYKT